MADTSGNVLTNTIQGASSGGIVGGLISFASSGIKSVLNLFGAKPVGNKGWQTYIANAQRPVGAQNYPSAAQLLAANLTSDPKELAAIASTYDRNTGTGSEGDWHFAVTSVNPIVLDWYKGDSEHFQTKAAAQDSAFGNLSPLAQSGPPQTQAQAAAFGGGAGTTTPPPTPPAPGMSLPTWLKPVAIGVGILLTLIGIFLTLKRRR